MGDFSFIFKNCEIVWTELAVSCILGRAFATVATHTQTIATWLVEPTYTSKKARVNAFFFTQIEHSFKILIHVVLKIGSEAKNCQSISILKLDLENWYSQFDRGCKLRSYIIAFKRNEAFEFQKNFLKAQFDDRWDQREKRLGLVWFTENYRINHRDDKNQTCNNIHGNYQKLKHFTNLPVNCCSSRHSHDRMQKAIQRIQ